MNIKQAASLLNVSEVSLRRWTDAGRLPCLRVGMRRERRFRREDLFAFLEGVAPPETARPRPQYDADPALNAAEVMLEGLLIERRSHLCALYESDAGRAKLAVPFLTGGLCAGEICYLVAPAKAIRQIKAELEGLRPDLDGDLEAGRLVTSEGMASGREMHAFLEAEFIRATRAGDRSLRLLGDMAWALDQGLDLEELYHFELRYNHALARRFPMVSLCQYDVRRFSGVGVLNALRCHEDTFRLPLSRFLG